MPPTLSGIDVRETFRGVRFVLPMRQGGSARLAGLPMMLFGSVFAGAGLFVIVEAVLELIDKGDAGGVCSVIFGLPFLAVGLAIFVAGLFALIGHSEIELRDEQLVAIVGWGPIRWRRRRSRKVVKSFSVVPAGKRLSGLAKIRVECEGAAPLDCAVGYDGQMLSGLAKELARRWRMSVTDRTTSAMAEPASASRSERRFSIAGVAAKNTALAGSVASNRRENVPLSPDGNAMGGCALLFFAVLWNGVSWTIAAVMFLTDDEEPPVFAMVILGIFMLVGVAIAVGAVKQLLAQSKLRQPEVIVSAQPLRIGEPFTGSFVQRAKSPAVIDRVAIKLICRERATYRRGTNTTTVTHDVSTELCALAEKSEAGPTRPIRGEFAFAIPEDAMHTFLAGNNKIIWLLECRTEVAGWPDYTATFTLQVAPLRHP